jgi:4'-phosphopantetheinyl transferase EntD
MTDDFTPEYHALVSQVMSLPSAVHNVTLLSAQKAALFLAWSPGTLEARRNNHEPPPPAVGYAGVGMKSRSQALTRKYLCSPSRKMLPPRHSPLWPRQVLGAIS